MLILASTSATRKALLQATGLRFETSPAQIDERAIEAGCLGKGAAPVAIARALAIAKADEVSRRRPKGLVIGADQVLALGESLFHKPADAAEALRHLGALAGQTHQLHAGVALVRDGAVLWSHVETASLTMRQSSAEERQAVLALEGEAVLSSVGGYRLEGPSIRLFERVEGDYFTILGLPVLPLLDALRQFAPDLMEPRP